MSFIQRLIVFVLCCISFSAFSQSASNAGSYYLFMDYGSYWTKPPKYSSPDAACSDNEPPMLPGYYTGNFRYQPEPNGKIVGNCLGDHASMLVGYHPYGVIFLESCPAGEHFDPISSQCVNENNSCQLKIGQTAASGYLALGENASATPAGAAVCHDGCAATFAQESANSTVLVLGVKHYYAHGAYRYNGNACTPGAPLPPMLAALPADTCAPGNVLSQTGGAPACVPDNGGGGGGGNNGSGQAVITFYHNDPSGSPIVATDEAGNLLWKENYRPYGSKLNASNSSEDNPIGFHGKPFDDHTGLTYMGARYYHPVLGRFTGVDPVGFLEENIHSHNRYAYANDNPYKYVDPDGRSPRHLFRLIGQIFKKEAKQPTKQAPSKPASTTNPSADSNKVGGGLPKNWEIPQEVTDKLPSNWTSSPNNKGVGTKWFDPKKPERDGVRIDQGNPDHSFPTQQVDHVIVRRNGRVIGRDGKPIRGPIDDNAVDAHIPLSEYQKWKNWDSPI